MTLKTRDLPLYEYFTKLQEEYICAELRHKIYPRVKDKQYYSKVKEGKRKTIEDISFRNGLPSIFNSESQKQKVHSIIYKQGYPNFIYRDDKEKQSLSFNDKRNYYSVGNDFKINNNLRVGVLKQIDLEKEICILDIDNELCQYNISQITRIL
jgi:hypothetical protein